MKNFLRKVQSLGLRIDTVYDIGAFKGRWSMDTKSVCPNSQFILFEANPVYATDLKNSGFKNFNIALSNPGRTSIDFYNGTNTGDSYYKETTVYYNNQNSITLPCYTLDYIVSQNNLPTPEFIKLDTQGSELDILEGAKSFINEVDLIYTEVPILCYNNGAPNIQDYIEYFKRIGFVPMDIFERHHCDSILVQIDIMFMRFETKERIIEHTKTFNPFL
jgi:FkbM family methyltransferase